MWSEKPAAPRYLISSIQQSLLSGRFRIVMGGSLVHAAVRKLLTRCRPSTWITHLPNLIAEDSLATKALELALLCLLV